MVPNSYRTNAVPNSRVSSFQTTRAGDAIHIGGSPIGLLLVLTYAANIQQRTFGDFRPNSRIVNT